jgi:stage II sporulation protein D
MKTRSAILLVALLALAVFAAPAGAKTRFTVRGAGFGHGVGMSQWGAFGYASHGWGYRDILRHYYTDTAIGSTGARDVRVILQDGTRRASFTGASAAAGKALNPDTTYGVRRGRTAGTLVLLSPSGRKMKTVAAPLRVTGNMPLVLNGRALNGVTGGAYRGALEFRPGSIGGVASINALSLEDYVRGVVARESPSGWPIEALKAQAVAARSYAVTTSKAGAGWDQYPDTRSQVYGGVSAETVNTDAAVAATRGEVVTYDGAPVVTFFFSTSGGRTEDVENTSLGTAPQPWLKSVEDPYDDASPKHRWGPYQWTYKTAARKLRGLVKGSFKGIQVRRRGRSPRVVTADVVGSRGRTEVTGATLRARLGLFDSWVYFTSIKSDTKPAPKEPEPSPTGGATPEARATKAMGRRLTGSVFPARAGRPVQVELRQGRRWIVVGTAQTTRGGGYAFALERPGAYRVRFRGAAGPVVRVG